MVDLEPEGKKSAPLPEDLRVGQRFPSGKRRIDEEQIRGFAAQFGRQPFHLDPAAARATLIGGLGVNGRHTTAITMQFLVESGMPITGGIIGAGGDISWPHPTRPGDALQAESEVLALRPSRSLPDRGVATLRSETRNQHGDTVQMFVSRPVVPRPHGSPAQTPRLLVSPAAGDSAQGRPQRPVFPSVRRADRTARPPNGA